jgi:hypothetical protein
VRQDFTASAQHKRLGVDVDRGKCNQHLLPAESALLDVRREAHAHSHALLDRLGPPAGLCRLE